MNQPCYNSIALARHQHEIDRQEAKEHWIAAAVDRLLDDEIWLSMVRRSWISAGTNQTLSAYTHDAAVSEANREYQQHLSALEQARIDGQEGL